MPKATPAPATGKASPPELMTQAAYARYRGVERQSVQKWKEQDKLVLVEVDGAAKPRVHVAKSDRLLGATQNPLKAQSEPAAAASSEPVEIRDEVADRIKTSRAMKESADARMSHLKYQRHAGALVPRVEVRGVGPAAAALLHQSMDRRRIDLAKKLEGRTLHEILTTLKNDDAGLLMQYAEALRDFDDIANPKSGQSNHGMRQSA